MKMGAILVWILAVSPVWGRIDIQLSEDENVKINLSASSGYQRVSGFMRQDSHSVRFSVLHSLAMPKTFLPVLSYAYSDFLSRYFRNKTSIAFGYLTQDFEKENGWSRDFNTPLLGISTDFQKKLGRFNAFMGASGVYDLEKKNRSAWDNFKLEGGGRTTLGYREISWLGELQFSSRFYNPDRYFFVQRHDRLALTVSPVLDGDSWQVTPFAGLELENLDGDPYHRFQHYGLTIDVFRQKLIAPRLRIGYSVDGIERTTTKMISVGSRKDSWFFELSTFKRDGPVWLQERNVGLKLVFAFDGSKFDSEPIFKIRQYDNAAENFYSDLGTREFLNIGLAGQANRLRDIGSVTRWAGNNLRYLPAGWRDRNPSTVYTVGGGDCDEQAGLTAWLNQQNGHRSYVLSYWAGGRGHAAEVVQDQRTKRWFLSEYGVLQEIRGVENLSVQEVMHEALRQGSKFLAVGIPNNKYVYYEYYRPSQDPQKMYYHSFYSIYDVDNNGGLYVPYFQSTAESKPFIEIGSELYTGQDALWK